MSEIPYAHSRSECPPEKWQPLASHLKNTAAFAAAFAAAFHSSAWAELLGELHDIGKARRAFQQYLLRSNGLLEQMADDFAEHSHSGFGGCYAVRKFPRPIGLILAYCIAGHHAGLPDRRNGNAGLEARLQNCEKQLDDPDALRWLRENESRWQTPAPLVPPWTFQPAEVSMWIRMLFSCLTDADFLDTERFMDAARHEERGGFLPLAGLAARFDAELARRQSRWPANPLNTIRTRIRTACEEAAGLPPGLFSLTVPTGGGKTLSSTAFALRHAARHGLERIIYVIPYTSIIEQTAEVLREFFGGDQVLEHHSNFAPEQETPRSRLAAENWDAPVIVTTAVQFFESLYSAKAGRCRKLHRIANSVVILDEVQLLPPALLLPCCQAIRQLAAHYRTTLLLSTATQPELPLLERVREIIPPELELFKRLKRTGIVFPEDLAVRREWSEIAEELKQFRQVLCVVNTRRDCRALWELLPAGTIHLSAAMCGEHRSQVIREIKRRLAAGEQVRVVSTQLVEAGVDIDFPVVYRAMAGLPSIAQAAGRCNREGRLPGLGKVVVFVPPTQAPPGELGKGEAALREMLAAAIDPDDAAAYPAYFHLFYRKCNDLGTEFDELLTRHAGELAFQFREADGKFRMVDDRDTAPLIVRYRKDERDRTLDDIVNELRRGGPDRNRLRRLQRYAVNVPRALLDGFCRAGLVEEVCPGILVQCEKSTTLYSGQFGVDFNCEGFSVEDLNI